MARVTIMPLSLHMDTKENSTHPFDVQIFWPGSSASEQGITLIDAKVRRVVSHNVRLPGDADVDDVKVPTLQIMFDPGTFDGIELPAYWKLDYETDYSGNFEECPVLKPDVYAIRRWAAEHIIEKYSCIPPWGVASTATRCMERLADFSADKIAAYCDMSFDLRSEHDRASKWRIDSWGEGMMHIHIHDSEMPHVEPRSVAYQYGNALRKADSDHRLTIGELIPAIVLMWTEQAATGTDYQAEFDAMFTSRIMTTARKSVLLASKAQREATTKHVYSGRSLRLHGEESVPFPTETMALAIRPEYENVLFLRTTQKGGYAKSSSTADDRDIDHVLVHRSEGCHRFVFVDYVETMTEVCTPQRMAMIWPIAVEDEECSREMTYSPQRGMDPRLTKAVYGNPYFASALHHALSRRAYLRSRWNWQGKIEWKHIATLPGLFRSAGRVRPSRHTSLGRRLSRSGEFTISNTVHSLIELMGTSTLPFANVQRVAPAKSTARPIRLDL